MPRRANQSRQDAHYHVYNRGVNHGLIFLEDDNYRFFLCRLKQYAAEASAEIVAYCLMPTHYHLLVRPRGGELSSLMHRLGMSYANALNKRLHRVGPLFQGRFQAKLVARDAYLLHLSRYIHLNPVAAGLAARAHDWPHSSYIEFIDPKARTLVNPNIILDQLAPSEATPSELGEAYRRFVEEAREDVALLGSALFQE